MPLSTWYDILWRAEGSWAAADGSQDSTLIVPASGKKHADSATDWKWWHSSVATRLRNLYNEEGCALPVCSESCRH